MIYLVLLLFLAFLYTFRAWQMRERQALVDVLTGLRNRRGAEEALTRELARAERDAAPLSVAMIDIDRFKGWNDRLGHAMGDQILRVVAGVLAAEARRTDTVARWGGEEFLAILPVSQEGAQAFCERVRAALAEVGGGVTVSAGTAEWRFGEDLAATLERADRRLYQAKAAGRDCVCVGASIRFRAVAC